jgi:hypothetical protein
MSFVPNVLHVAIAEALLYDRDVLWPRMSGLVLSLECTLHGYCFHSDDVMLNTHCRICLLIRF